MSNRTTFFRLIATLLPVIAVLFAENLAAEDNKEALIERATSAAPPSVSDEATVMALDGTVLREGSNRWTCLPGIKPGDDHPMCNDAVWMEAMDALANQEEISTQQIGISYMLQGDAHVNNADPYDTEKNDGESWVQEGPHLMIIVPDKATLANLPDDPHSGGPYVMWKDTPYAHIMIPTSDREVR